MLLSYSPYQATIFLNYASEGALFVFGAQSPGVFNDSITGEPTEDVTIALGAHQFAFRVLPTIIFFSSFIAVVYHFGLIQLVVAKVTVSSFLHTTEGFTFEPP